MFYLKQESFWLNRTTRIGNSAATPVQSGRVSYGPLAEYLVLEKHRPLVCMVRTRAGHGG